MTKLVKESASYLPEHFVEPLRILSGGLLRSGRRSKRAALELSATIEPLINQYRLVEYCKKAIQDRKRALVSRTSAKRTLESNLTRLSMAKTGADRQASRILRAEAAVEASKRALEIEKDHASKVASVLTTEVGKLREERRKDYIKCTKILCSSFRECYSERIAIWEQAKVQFDEAFGEDFASASEDSAPSTIKGLEPGTLAPSVTPQRIDKDRTESVASVDLLS